jgi:hypothetical protein
MVKYFRSQSPAPGESNMALLGIRLTWQPHRSRTRCMTAGSWGRRNPGGVHHRWLGISSPPGLGSASSIAAVRCALMPSR